MNIINKNAEKLQSLGALLEASPELSKELRSVYSHGSGAIATFEFHKDYNTVDTRKDLEDRISNAVKVFGIEFEGNEPSGYWGSKHYELSGDWEGIKIELTTARENVCEKVVVGTFDKEVEIPDPELTKGIPLVKQIIQEEVTEWMCNETISEARKLVGAR